MGLKEQILEDMKLAMKSQQADRLSAIRMLQSAVKNREIELRPAAISDQEIVGVIRKLGKQRKDSIEQYQSAGRQDLADKEQFELSVLEGYLPKQLSNEELGGLVNEVIKALNATSIKQMGAVIKEVQVRTGGAADNKLVSELVKSKLQG
ncbi:MAG: GatB/YqeY domain-containing protein [Bdellovibrionales bacterium]